MATEDQRSDCNLELMLGVRRGSAQGKYKTDPTQ